jgi:general secretion pathway protein M
MKWLLENPWLNGLDPRERNLVIFGAVAVICLLIYALGWDPLVKETESLRKRNQEQQALVAWMQNAAQEVKQLRRMSGAPAHLPQGQSLLTTIDRTAKTTRLAGAMKRVQPDGDNRVRVWLEDAGFDDVMKWLNNLEQRQGVVVVSSVFEAKDQPGHVDGRLVFETGQ